jgi:hypothetical protein
MVRGAWECRAGRPPRGASSTEAALIAKHDPEPGGEQERARSRLCLGLDIEQCRPAQIPHAGHLTVRHRIRLRRNGRAQPDLLFPVQRYRAVYC